MKAFPNMTNQQGMDLRDYFAAKVLAGIVVGGEDFNPEQLAKFCYRMADAMMKAREK